MGRNILFITTDQQRYDALGCNGGTVARTPAVDGLAADGIRFERAYAQNTVCMPARSTMLTGQYVRTHGVVANGIPLPNDAPSVAETLAGNGYRTALIGKAHFEPIHDPELRWAENRMAAEGSTGPYRGFEHAEFANHGPWGASHYAHWVRENHREFRSGFANIFDITPGGETGAPEVALNPVPRGVYHTDWVADRVTDWLDSLDSDDDWFCWMSFPDPHHPWDPPDSERGRVDWRDLDLPVGHPGSDERIREILATKPAHWLAWYEGSMPNVDAAPGNFVPAELTHDRLREIGGKIHIENELIDDGCARVLRRISERGWDADTDVIFTTDHGELQGDFGLLYKGPFHVDALMRLPMVWRPAPSAGVAPAVVGDPVGQLDLAPTFCEIAGVEVPEWMQGTPLPTSPDATRERALCEWDSQLDTGYHLRTIVRDGWVCTVYEPSTPETGLAAADLLAVYGVDDVTRVLYDGTEGELYNLDEDPRQWVNRWDDDSCARLRSDLVAELYESLPAPRDPPLEVESMA